MTEEAEHGYTTGPDPSETEPFPISDELVRRLAAAVAHLNNEPEWFIRALTEVLFTMTPVARERLSVEEVRFLVDSGEFTAEEWFETSTAVSRGGLQLDVVVGWLSGVLQTKSLEDVTAFLGWDSEAVLNAVREDRLYAIDISNSLRFPSWQFHVSAPEKLLPGLAELIGIVSPHWQWRSIAGFMETRQQSLISEGRKSPFAWLSDGGDIDAIRQIVESDSWW